MRKSCWNSPAIAIAMIILACIVSHGLSIKTGFCYDDWTWLKLARSWHTGQASVFGPNPWNTFRPITHLLWFMDYELFADRAIGYHLVSMLLYILTAVSLYALIRRLTGSAASAFIGALLFATGVGHAEAVESCATQGIVLAGLLGVLCLILADKYATTGKPSRLIGSLVICAAAPLAHEVAVVVPFGLLLYAILFARRKSMKRFGVVAVTAVIAFLLWGASYWGYYHANRQGICEQGEPSLLATRHIAPNMMRAVPTLIMPDVQSPALRDKLRSKFPTLIHPLDRFSTGLAIVLLAAGALGIIIGASNQRLGVLWCLSGLLVGSLSDLGFQGRYLYIPMISAALVLGPLLAGWLTGKRRWLRSLTTLVLIVLIASNLATSLLGLMFRVKYAQERYRLIGQIRQRYAVASAGPPRFYIVGLPYKLKDVVDACGYYGIKVAREGQEPRPAGKVLTWRYVPGSPQPASKD